MLIVNALILENAGMLRSLRNPQRATGIFSNGIIYKICCIRPESDAVG